MSEEAFKRLREDFIQLTEEEFNKLPYKDKEESMSIGDVYFIPKSEDKQ